MLYTPPGQDKKGRPVEGRTRNVADLLFESTSWPHKNGVIREALKLQGCDRTGGAYAEEHHRNPTEWRHTDISRQHKRPEYASARWENHGESRNQRVQAAADSESSCSTEPTAKRRCDRSKSRALSRRRADDSRSPEHHGDYRPSGASSSSRQLPVQSQGYSGWYGKNIRESSRGRR